MKLRDRMIYAAIVSSSLKRRHPPHIREFFRDLLHACDDHGRFDADVKEIRPALFGPILDRVSERDVEGYLQRLSSQEHGDIKLYTVRGKRFGKVVKWRQTRLKNLVAEYPPEDGDPELPLASADPPPKKSREKKERKKEECGPAAAGGTHDTRLAELCLSELQSRWPRHDVAACLRRAERHVRKERGGDATVPVWWFAKHWMPGESEAKPKPPPPITAKTVSDEDAAAVRAEWKTMPEPPKGTLEHALWEEARR